MSAVARRVNGERIALAGWSRAILLQVAHPLVAAGVAAHSDFHAGAASSARRLHHTVGAMLGLTFGTPADRARVIAGIRTLHRRVNGTLTEPVGRFPAGTRYSAEDPALVLWVHATIVESTVIAYDTLVATLSSGDRDEYCRDAASVAVELGARPDEVPLDWDGLERYLEGVYASDTLAVGRDGGAIAAALLSGSFARLVGPVGWMNRLITAGWLPPTLRAAYGLRWDDGCDRRFRRALAVLRGLRRATPRVLACWRRGFKVSGVRGR